jgi:hypothetical protein
VLSIHNLPVDFEMALTRLDKSAKNQFYILYDAAEAGDHFWRCPLEKRMNRRSTGGVLEEWRKQGFSGQLPS